MDRTRHEAGSARAQASRRSRTTTYNKRTTSSAVCPERQATGPSLHIQLARAKRQLNAHTWAYHFLYVEALHCTANAEWLERREQDADAAIWLKTVHVNLARDHDLAALKQQQIQAELTGCDRSES